MVSASATQASLPDCTITPRMSSSTLTGLLGSMNMREPSMRQALVETGTTWSGLSEPSLSLEKVM
jgi:hypothetical protein